MRSTCAGVNGGDGEVGALVEGAEQVRDVVHPLRELGPVARAAVVERRRHRLVAREQRDEVGVRGRAQRLRVGGVEVAPEREHAAGKRQHHEAVRDRLARGSRA